VISTCLWSLPGFWLGVLLVLAFSVTWPIFPVSGYSGLKSLVLPLTAVVVVPGWRR
jgi:ABC-type dipeptide/oligopeptide/nickel transport system permease component